MPPEGPRVSGETAARAVHARGRPDDGGSGPVIGPAPSQPTGPVPSQPTGPARDDALADPLLDPPVSAGRGRPLRVLMLTNMYPHPQDLSFGTFVEQQVRALRNLGVSVDVLFVNGRASRLNYLAGYPRLWLRLRRRGYDLVHAHYVFSGLIARAQFRLPVVQSFHAPGQSHTWQGWLARHLASRVDAVTVTSQEHHQLLGFPPARVIPCGVDLERFRPMPREEARARVGWPAEGVVLLWLGDPRKEKRVDLAYTTHEELRSKMPHVGLRVVSKVPHQEVPFYLNAADVLLLTSDHEGSPVIVKEALACNLPVVSTRVGDVADLLHGVDGCHLAEQDPRDLAAKVALALAGGGRTRGRAKMEAWSTTREAERIVQVYREVLEARRGRRPGRQRRSATGHGRGRPPEAAASGASPDRRVGRGDA